MSTDNFFIFFIFLLPKENFFISIVKQKMLNCCCCCSLLSGIRSHVRRRIKKEAFRCVHHRANGSGWWLKDIIHVKTGWMNIERDDVEVMREQVHGTIKILFLKIFLKNNVPLHTMMIECSLCDVYLINCIFVRFLVPFPS